jgi:predicted anti-sigma-YlaC factor YlaD
MDTMNDDEFEALIERSSLGTPGARQLRQRTPPAQAHIARNFAVGLTACEHGSTLLGAHMLGGLDPADADAIEQHLATCAGCRAEQAELEKLLAVLDEVPPEAFLDGPPNDADLIVARAIRQIRRERTGGQRSKWLLSAAAAVVVIAALVTAGVVIGRSTDTDVTAQPATSTTAPTPPAGTRVLQAMDPTTRARITARIVPAAGWVRVHAAVTGVKAGQRCRLVVIATDGTREVAGSFLVSPTGEQQGTALDGAALIRPEDVRAVVVENFDGQQLVAATV